MTREELETTNEQIGYRLSEIAAEMNRLRLEQDTLLNQRLENMQEINRLLHEELKPTITRASGVKGERKNDVNRRTII